MLKRRDLARGFTLLEVLIAVLIFSFGMLGIAGMVVTSMRGNHTAQLHTQATFLAQWIEDAMRSNPVAVMAGQYNGSGVVGTPDPCSSGCTPAQAATRDLTAWGSMVARALPAGQGAIRCQLNSPVRPSDGVNAFPTGLCTVVLTWNEASEADKRSASTTPGGTGRRNKRLDWVFNP